MSGQAASERDEARAADLAGLRLCYERLIARLAGKGGAAGRAEDPPSGLARLQSGFGLTEFETDLILWAAAPDLCAVLGVSWPENVPDRPSLAAALAAHPLADWDAVRPGAVLRRGRLIRVADSDETGLRVRLRTDEAVINALLGAPCLDERLMSRFRPLPAGDPPGELGERIRRLWADGYEQGEMTLAHIATRRPGVGLRAAAAAAEALGQRLYIVEADDLPAEAERFDAVNALWDRDAILLNAALAIDASRESGPAERRLAWRFADRTVAGAAIIDAETAPPMRRAVLSLQPRAPDAPQRDALWRAALGERAEKLNGALERIAESFPLDADQIAMAARRFSAETGAGEEPVEDRLWRTARRQASAELDGLAQHIPPRARFEDLVLPRAQLDLLDQMIVHLRHRVRVQEDWGFAARSSRGLGLSALFSGPSGTGKTMAAEVIADAQQLDLFRIDLASVVSKYIGETEKNLERLFAVAEASGAILLFDEADALFGKRSEVKDAHDRYANLEVSYLLQRMEAYGGLAILTSNMKEALDPAFLRRLRFHVQFPHPNEAQRVEIWRRIFPPETPTEGLDLGKLARLSVAGGNIRSIALNAAFLAAEENKPVGMGHLQAAANMEYAKLGRVMSESEIRGWT